MAEYDREENARRIGEGKVGIDPKPDLGTGIRAALADQDEWLTRLEKSLSGLQDRLEPLLQSDFPDDEEKSPGESPEGNAPVVQDIRRGNGRIALLTKRVQRLGERVHI